MTNKQKYTKKSQQLSDWTLQAKIRSHYELKHSQFLPRLNCLIYAICIHCIALDYSCISTMVSVLILQNTFLGETSETTFKLHLLSSERTSKQYKCSSGILSTPWCFTAVPHNRFISKNELLTLINRIPRLVAIIARDSQDPLLDGRAVDVLNWSRWLQVLFNRFVHHQVLELAELGADVGQPSGTHLGGFTHSAGDKNTKLESRWLRALDTEGEVCQWERGTQTDLLITLGFG